LVEESLLDHALGSNVVLELGEESFEFFAVFGTDDEVFRGESVLAGVLGGAGLAVKRAGAGAELGVGSVGGLAGGGRSHDVLLGYKIRRKRGATAGRLGEIAETEENSVPWEA
jgi:hypothetical protein